MTALLVIDTLRIETDQPGRAALLEGLSFTLAVGERMAMWRQAIPS